jgi:hypothetical protein
MRATATLDLGSSVHGRERERERCDVNQKKEREVCCTNNKRKEDYSVVLFFKHCIPLAFSVCVCVCVCVCCSSFVFHSPIHPPQSHMDQPTPQESTVH